MTRTNQQLYPLRTPATLKPAATLLFVRDAQNEQGENVLEVLMTKRSPKASFAAGVYVFPGGTVDDFDSSERALAVAQHRKSQDTLQITRAIAAIRESFEELGILLAYQNSRALANQQTISRLNRQTSLIEQAHQHHLKLALDQIYPFAHWQADLDLPKRFDALFFVAKMPPNQEPIADETEQFEPIWIRAKDALEQHQKGQFPMIFPTIRTLERLKKFDSTKSLLDVCKAANEQVQWTSCPRTGFLNGIVHRVMEHESAYGELQLVCPDGQIKHELQWQSKEAVSLLKNVKRLTAPNAGLMTGPGTNTYLVGDAQTGFAVIDPGALDQEHVLRIWRACEGKIRFIICTHSHPDHSPAAKPLQDLCVEKNGTKPLILGLSSTQTARATSYFKPDLELKDQERLVLDDVQTIQSDEINSMDQHQQNEKHPENLKTIASNQYGSKAKHTLRVILTPGHASNHVCLVLEEDALLFSGDHILNGSTTVIDPPDGNMKQYLDSLDVLDAVCEKDQIDFILPAHGYVLGSARTTIAQLKAHRLMRDAKVRAALQAKPEGNLDDWISMVYADVPAHLWAVAKRSLLAHIEFIKQTSH